MGRGANTVSLGSGLLCRPAELGPRPKKESNMAYTEAQTETAPDRAQLARLLMQQQGGAQPVQVAGGTDALIAALMGAGALTGAAVDAKFRGDGSMPAQIADRANAPMPPPDETGMVRPFLLPFGYDANKLEPALVWPNILARPVLDAKKSWETGEMPSPGEALGIAGLAMPGAIAGRAAKAPNAALADELMRPARGTMQGVPNVYQKPGEYFANEIKKPDGVNVVPDPTKREASVMHHTEVYDSPMDQGQEIIRRIGSNKANMPIFTDTKRFAPHYQAEIKARVDARHNARPQQHREYRDALSRRLKELEEKSQ